MRRLAALIILSLLLVAALPSVAAPEILGVDDGKAARTTNGTSLAVGLANAPAASDNTVVLPVNGSAGRQWRSRRRPPSTRRLA